jgi:hypothetical protein
MLWIDYGSWSSWFRDSPARPNGEPGFLAKTEDIRLVRNVSDHLGQRAAYVAANGGAALGVLQWATPRSRDEVLSCSIRPTRLMVDVAPFVNVSKSA